MNRTYHIWTIGCQMNQADTRSLAVQLEENGYEPEAKVQKADVVVLNTCVIRQQAEDKAYDQLRQLKGLKRRRPELIIAVMGCLVGRKADASLHEKFPFVDIFMGPLETAPLIQFLSGNDEPFRGRGIPPSECGKTVTAFVPVILGCSHTCAYCVIPSRRGGERSRPKRDHRGKFVSLPPKA